MDSFVLLKRLSTWSNLMKFSSLLRSTLCVFVTVNEMLCAGRCPYLHQQQSSDHHRSSKDYSKWKKEVIQIVDVMKCWRPTGQVELYLLANVTLSASVPFLCLFLYFFTKFILIVHILLHINHYNAINKNP